MQMECHNEVVANAIDASQWTQQVAATTTTTIWCRRKPRRSIIIQIAWQACKRTAKHNTLLNTQQAAIEAFQEEEEAMVLI